MRIWLTFSSWWASEFQYPCMMGFCNRTMHKGQLYIFLFLVKMNSERKVSLFKFQVTIVKSHASCSHICDLCFLFGRSAYWWGQMQVGRRVTCELMLVGWVWKPQSTRQSPSPYSREEIMSNATQEVFRLNLKCNQTLCFTTICTTIDKDFDRFDKDVCPKMVFADCWQEPWN